ncbi:hypothetical protein A3Q56_07001 [Intoshia linei]|uniref:Uncharacterized protein n=1 Tax=Intoshia linei TaxID=1819745 RepID=A0A177ATH3_9BILA|nr:hypothetical protein A3Q56_07001 [Intoshia linei]
MSESFDLIFTSRVLNLIYLGMGKKLWKSNKYDSIVSKLETRNDVEKLKDEMMNRKKNESDAKIKMVI